MKNFRQMIREASEKNSTLLGTFLQLPSPEITEIFGYAGFDFVIIDNEHAPISTETTVRMVRAAETSGCMSLVRVPDCSETNIKKALDSGANAVLVPGVKDIEDIRRVIAFSKFAPEGVRGACPGVRANHFGTGGTEFYQEANRCTAVRVQIETPEACEQIEEIVRLEGLDGILLGPVDLSVNMGLGGNANHPRVIAALNEVFDKAKAAGMAVAAFAMDEDTGREWIRRGLDLLAYGIDDMLLLQMAKNIRERVLPRN